jgi:hypothetical protein
MEDMDINEKLMNATNLQGSGKATSGKFLQEGSNFFF